MKRLRSSKRFLMALTAGVILLAVAGIVLLGAYFYTSRSSSATISNWVNPLAAVEVKAVAPDLAALTLAGETDERVIKAALDAGELETAYATLVYSALLPDAARSGQLLLLGRRFEAQPQRASVCYQALLDLAALGPTLSDIARADVSLQIARTYADLNPEIARLALAQAENIARYSLTLLPAQRRSTLELVSAAYQAQNDPKAAQAIREKLAVYAAGPGVSLEPKPPLLSTLRGSIVLPEKVTETIVARQQAAAGLAARWLTAEAGERQALATALGDALAAEDAARAAFYAAAGSLPLADQLALLHDQAAWLTIKYRVARGAYGVSLVSEWEGDAAAIGSALAATYTGLINGYGRQLDVLDAAEAVQARVELLRQGLLWARLGLFPDAPEQTLSEQLAEASRQLWTRQGGAGLTVVAQEVNGQHFYFLAGSDAAVGP